MAAKKKSKKKAAKKAVKKTIKKTAKKAVKKSVKKAAPKAAKKTETAKSLLGKAAPAFTMATDSGGKISLKDLRGKNVVLYFYPKDDTPGCTVEACAFRDGLPRFNTAKAVVIGVSKDSVASHAKFKAKYKLNFTLGSDDSGVCEAYGVWKEKNMYGRKYMGIERSTFIIDGKGIVKAEWRKVSVPGHADEVTKTLQML